MYLCLVVCEFRRAQGHVQLAGVQKGVTFRALALEVHRDAGFQASVSGRCWFRQMGSGRFQGIRTRSLFKGLEINGA